MKGAKTQIGSATYTLAYDYIEFQLLFNIILPVDNNLISYAFEGLFIALNANSKIITKYIQNKKEFIIEKTRTEEYGGAIWNIC